MENLADFGHGLSFCFEIVFGHIKPVRVLLKFDKVAAMVFMLPFTTMITFIMLYLFTAIIVNAFHEKADQLERFYKLKEEEEIPKLWFMYRLKNWLKSK